MMRRRTVLLATLALAAVLLCTPFIYLSAAGRSPTQLPDIKDYTPTEAHYAAHEKHMESRRVELEAQEGPLPRSAILEFVNPKEYGYRIQSCMKDFGHVIDADSSTYTWTEAEDPQARAEFHQHMYLCEFEYPTRGDMTAPYTLSERIYWYRTIETEFVPCIQEFEMPEYKGPSRLRFVFFEATNYNPAEHLRELYPEESNHSIASKVSSCSLEMSPVRIYPGYDIPVR